MDSRIHDEQRGRQRDVGEHAEARGIGRIQPHLVGELLGVLRPSLSHAGGPEVASDRRERVAALERNCALQMVAGNGFVERQRLEIGP